MKKQISIETIITAEVMQMIGIVMVKKIHCHVKKEFGV
jgi:hypothetical protein